MKTLPEGFDWVCYLDHHPDLVKAGIITRKSAVQHYLSFGRREGRSYRGETLPLPEGFDWVYYIDHHPDLVKAGITTCESAVQHYLSFGRREGRSYRETRLPLNQLRERNAGFKTANLAGILFLIGDSSDELGYHFEGHVVVPPAVLAQSLMARSQAYPQKYLFTVIPDKSVILSDFLRTHLVVGPPLRPHVLALQSLDFVVDSYPTIVEICRRHKKIMYNPVDSHSPPLALYAYYVTVIRKIGALLKCALRPVDVAIYDQQVTVGDLTHPLNNGNRPLGTVRTDPIPSISLKVPLHVNRFQIKNVRDPQLWAPSNICHLNQDQMLGGVVRKEFDIDCYENPNATYDFKVLYFHDSNLWNPVIQQCFASHFKYTYFRWSTFDDSIVQILKPDLIIEESMERFLNTYRSV